MSASSSRPTTCCLPSPRRTISPSRWTSRGAPPTGPGSARLWTRWAWARGCGTARRSCPAGSSSGSPSRGPWPAGRKSSSPTSPPATSIPAPARRSWTCSVAACASSARRSSWSLTTRRPRATPTGSSFSPTGGSPTCSTSPPRRPCWTGWPLSKQGVPDMLRTMFAGLRRHTGRLAMTALAVALGTGLMAGSFVFTATLTRSLDSLFAQATAGTDVQVRHVSPPGAVQGAGSATAQPVPASVLPAVRALPDVSAADGTVSGRAVLLGRDGKPLPAPFVAALSWPSHAPFQAVFTGRQGRPPAGPGQVMIDRGSARAGHFTVGDHIEVAIGGHALPFTISGITGYAGADSLAGGSMAIFSLPAAQRLLGRPGTYDTIDVKAVPGVSPEQLRAEVARVLPAGVQAVTAVSAAGTEARQLNSQLGVLTTFFAAFAGVAMFVGAFVIWNTFSILIGQRSRQLALLRALGASRGQVFGSVLTEAAAVGIAGAIAGAVLGLAVSRGLVALLSAFGLSLPAAGLSVPLAQVALGCVLGLAVTVAAAVAPAVRATRVAPVQALRDAAPGSARF